MAYSNKEREQYNARRIAVCEALGIEKSSYNYLRRLGAQLHRYYEYDCNGVDATGRAWTESKSERFEGMVYEKADKYTIALGLYIYYQTDPRGATIYVDKKPIPDNNYTQAYVIY